MKKYFMILCFLTIFSPAHAVLLGQHQIVRSDVFGTVTGGSDSLRIYLAVSEVVPFNSFDPSTAWVFGGNTSALNDPFNLVVRETDVGSTFTTNALEPGFAEVATMLTDGELDSIISMIGVPDFVGGSGRPYDETEIFNGDPGFSGVDLFGNILNSISITINSVTIDPGEYLVTPMSYNIDYTIRFEGTSVPEPSGLFLIGIGLLGISFIRRINAT